MPKVMLIEDDASMLLLLSTLLQMEGFEIVQLTTERSIEEIIDTLEREMPKAALLDVHIFQLNGYDVLKRIRQTPKLRHLRIMMASGMDTHEECMAAGADSFILKPFMPDELIKRVWALTAIPK